MQFDRETEEALKKIHEGCHILFREIGRICKKHGISYHLDSGNLIGAIREHSDIPWDDDADISMTRADYEVFREAAKTELAPGFQFIAPEDTGDVFLDFIPRVILTDSKLRADSPEEAAFGGIYNHILCDIFIVDDVSDFLPVHKLNRVKQILIYGLAMGKRPALDMSSYHGFSRIVIRLLSMIGKHIRADRLTRAYDRVSKAEFGRNRRKNRCYFSNCLFPDVHKIYDKDWFTGTVYFPIDGEDFPCPAGYDRILWTLYESDYMVPPPAESISLPHCDPAEVELNYASR